MRPFNLDEYLKDPSRKVVTRDGRNVRIVCTGVKSEIYPVLALVDNGNEEVPTRYTKYGKFISNDEYPCDLFFAPEKHEGWMNIYKNERDHYFGKFIYPKKTDAEAVADSTCIATVKIEWEE